MDETAQVFGHLDRIGTLGLATLVYVLYRFIIAMQKGDYVTRREHEGALAREARLEQKLDKALDYGARALDAGESIAAKK